MTKLKHNSFYIGIAIICIIAVIKLIPAQKDDILVVLSCNVQEVKEFIRHDEKLQSFSNFIFKITKRNGEPDLIFMPVKSMIHKKSFSLEPSWKFDLEFENPPTYRFTTFLVGNSSYFFEINRESLTAEEYSLYDYKKNINFKYVCEKVTEKEFNNAFKAVTKEIKKEQDKLQF